MGNAIWEYGKSDTSLNRGQSNTKLAGPNLQYPNFFSRSGTYKVIDKLSQEKDSQQEALEKFKWKVVRDHEIKVLGEVNVELESGYQPIQLVVAQNNVLEEVAEEVIEMANDQAEALVI
ncbi:hypothetical protein Tco_1101073 [Tanacetum coccineum]